MTDLKLIDRIIMGAFVYGVSVDEIAKFLKMKKADVEAAIRREWKR